MLIKQRKKKRKDLQTSNTSQPGTKILYTSCNDLPYEVFKKLCVDKDYSLLGSGSDLELDTAYIKLYSEFCLLSGDEEIQGQIQEWAKLVYIESRLFRLKLFYSLHLDGYEIKNEWLTGVGLPPVFNAEKLLAKIQNEEATQKMLAAGLKKKSGKTEGKALTYAHFDETISQIERIFKVPIDTSKLSTQMYAIKIKDMRDHIRKAEKI
jgi:hypothetical protein